MIKGSYFITETDRKKNHRITEVNGYLFDKGGLAFGVRKRGHIWEVTDIKTGLLCSRDALRLKDTFQVITEDIISIIREAHNSTWNEVKEIIKDIEKAYSKAGYTWEIVA